VEQQSKKNTRQNPKNDFSAEREQRGQKTRTPAADQLGATEQEVTPLTPPMARSDEQPGDRQRGKESDKGIDPADELTPG
jgi:hypothetical protein